MLCEVCLIYTSAPVQGYFLLVNVLDTEHINDDFEVERFTRHSCMIVDDASLNIMAKLT